MRNNEYYQSNEFDNQNEYQPFEAENYKSKEYLDRLKEVLETPETSVEPNTTKLSKNLEEDLKKKESSDNPLKDIIKRMTENVTTTVRTVTTTVAAAAATVVVATGVIASKPTIEVIDMSSGNDYVSYNFEISDLNSDMSYYVDLSNGYDQFTFEINEGTNKNVVNGLKPFFEYNLQIIGKDENLNVIPYYKTKLYTSDSKDPRCNFDITSTKNLHHELELDLNYSIYISDYYKAYNDYFAAVEIMRDDHISPVSRSEEFPLDAIYENGYLKGTLEGFPIGDVKFKVYGSNNPDERTLIATYDYHHFIDEMNNLPNNFPGYFEPLTVDNIFVNKKDDGSFDVRVRYYLEVPNNDLRFNYEITLFNNDQIFDTFVGNMHSYDPVLNIPKDTESFQVKIKIFGKTDKEEKVYHDETLQDLIYPEKYVYNATYKEITSSDITIDYDVNGYNVVNIPINFDNYFDKACSYKIYLVNGTEIIDSYTGTAYKATLKAPTDINNFTIKYELLKTVAGETFTYLENEIFESFDVTKPDVTANGTFNLVDCNKYDVLNHFEKINNDFRTNGATLNIKYGDSPYESYPLDIVDPDASYFDVNYNCDYLPANTLAATVYYEIYLETPYGIRTVETVPETYELPYEVKIKDATYDIKNRELNVNFISHSEDHHEVVAINNSTLQESILNMNLGLYNFNELVDRAIISANYSYYIKDPLNQGTIITPTTELVIDTAFSANYNFTPVEVGSSYNNTDPLTIGILRTFNEDGTLNLYANVNFSSLDPDVYYNIAYDGCYTYDNFHKIKYTSNVASIENLRDDGYRITYEVCKDVGNLTYVLDKVEAGEVSNVEENKFYKGSFKKTGQENFFEVLLPVNTFDKNTILFKTDIIGDEVNVALTEDAGKFEIIEQANLSSLYKFKAYINASKAKLTFSGNIYSQTYEEIKSKINVKGTLYHNIVIDY